MDAARGGGAPNSPGPACALFNPTRRQCPVAGRRHQLDRRLRRPLPRHPSRLNPRHWPAPPYWYQPRIEANSEAGIGSLGLPVVEVAFATCEPGFTEFAVSVSPEIEGRSRDSEAVASRLDVANLLRVLEDSLLSSDFSLIFGHLDPLGQPLSSWQGVRLDL